MLVTKYISLFVVKTKITVFMQYNKNVILMKCSYIEDIKTIV